MKTFTTFLSTAIMVALAHAAVIPGNLTLSARANCLGKRDGFNTNVEVGPHMISLSRPYNRNAGENPDNTKHVPAWTTLWDNAHTLCGSTSCGLDDSASKQYCVDLQDEGYQPGYQICISLEGSFAADAGDNMIAILRQAFDRSVTQESNEIYLTESGVNYFHVVAGPGPYSGYDLAVNISFETPDTAECPAIVNAINAAGTLVPELAPFFGTAGAICALVG
jgi:hypothetical protein